MVTASGQSESRGWGKVGRCLITFIYPLMYYGEERQLTPPLGYEGGKEGGRAEKVDAAMGWISSACGRYVKEQKKDRKIERSKEVQSDRTTGR